MPGECFQFLVSFTYIFLQICTKRKWLQDLSVQRTITEISSAATTTTTVADSRIHFPITRN